MLNIALVFEARGNNCFVVNIFQDTQGTEKRPEAEAWWLENRRQLLTGISQGLIQGVSLTQIMNDTVDIIKAGTGIETRYTLSDQVYKCMIMPIQ